MAAVEQPWSAEVFLSLTGDSLLEEEADAVFCTCKMENRKCAKLENSLKETQ